MWGLWGSGIQANGGFASLGLRAVRAIEASGLRGASVIFWGGAVNEADTKKLTSDG